MKKRERKEYKKAWYEANKEQVLARNKAWYATHKQERKEYSKAWYEAHKEQERAKKKAWRAAHKERFNSSIGTH